MSRRTYTAPHTEAIAGRDAAQHNARLEMFEHFSDFDPRQHSSVGSSRHVNNLLHTLRGEQFRHSQNVARSRSHLKARLTPGPTLPVSLIHTGADSGSVDTGPRTSTAPPTSSTHLKTTAGPQAPRSWLARLEERDREERNTSAWRAHALGLVYPRLPNPSSALSSLLSATSARPSRSAQNAGEEEVSQPRTTPTLVHHCLRFLHLYSADAPEHFAEDVLPFLAPHLQRDMIRDAAIRLPLERTRLNAVYDAEGNAEGETIVVGPQATLRGEWLSPELTSVNEASGAASSEASRDPASDAEVNASDIEDDWDADAADSGGTPMSALILLSVKLPISLVLRLPPTLTILALVSMPTPVAVHRLPALCPLLAVLELSLNLWFDVTAASRVDWPRWRHLELLGIRGCAISPTQLTATVNASRWAEVEIVA